MTSITPRPHQQEILNYTRGAMGISAVPGSGKTWTLSALAAKLITAGYVSNDQEILIVTLTNSAVDNFSARINDFLGTDRDGHRPLIAPYRVRTLHGLAHDIVRERPDLVGLDSNFTIIDERAADQVRNQTATDWLNANPNALEDFLKYDLNENSRDWVRREQLPKLIQSIAVAFIRTAKDQQISPEQLNMQLDRLPVPLPLAEMGAAMYAEYQRALAYRGAVDFDDLIRLALQALHNDPNLLARLQNRWPYVLEDEAQDSSQLQERILRLIAGSDGNWVRVGDPNQAIFESFTTANPRYLRQFMRSCELPRELPNSGRSTKSIITLANYLIDWSRAEHPVVAVRDALDEPYIDPTPPGDPQPNPADQPDQIFLVSKKFSPEGELKAVAESIARWLPDHPDETVAVLVPRNRRGFALRDLLQEYDIPVNDSLLRSSASTRQAAGALGNILKYLGDPQNARKLSTIYQVWRRAEKDDPEAWAAIGDIANLIATCPRVEDFIWPRPGRDWLESLQLTADQPEIHESLAIFREYVKRWQGTVLLPVNQIILTLAQDLFEDVSDLAIAHKLAALLRQAENTNPNWRMPELATELAVIARNERRFLGFSADDSGFNPDHYKGQVVVATVHKAKGLEWDRVYLLSVSNYDFPSGMLYDSFFSEKWFIRDSLNLEAETLAQLGVAFEQDAHEWYQEGQGTDAARMEYVRERLRLLYVGITRAKKELVITWNAGRGKNESQAAIPLTALQTFWENRI